MVHEKMEGRMEWGKVIKSSVKAEREKKKKKTEAEEILHNLFYRASITLVSKSDKDSKHRKTTEQYPSSA